VKSRLAYLLIAGAAALYFWTARPSVAPPAPPSPPLEIDLSSAFQGERAAEDAATLAVMADEIANVIEWDGRQQEPLLITGRSLDQLRTRTREFLCRGESLGERHPKMRQIVSDFLEAHLGTSGGDVSPEQRASWVTAYREVARSARHAISH
jgi:hypothetical protein